MEKKNESAVVKFSTDTVAIGLYRTLVEDFKSVHGKTFASESISALGRGVKEFRSYKFPLYMGTSVPRFRSWYQLENFFKKYRFQDDAFTDQELEDLGKETYLDRQVSLATIRPRTLRSFLVLQEARRIAKAILGPFDPDLSQTMCRFGKNSSIGCPFALSYLDVKLSHQAAFTGSADGIRAFYEGYLPGDPILARILHRFKIERPKAIESLFLTQVPKTWKSLRGITPLSLLTLFRSYGIGGLVEQALANAGLPIDRLQQRHREKIQLFSKTKSHVTMDLSAASDSITSVLLNQVLPRQWYREARTTFGRVISIGGKEYHTMSVLPMGNGLTFPLETLVFYCLIKAVGNLSGVNGFFSAYGDDLIFPTRAYSYVLQIFDDIGLKVNVDKTFARTPFRESCGSDFYAGVDVRPAFLPSGGRLTRTQYVVWLYKAANALLRRWDPKEIPQTLARILIELTMHDKWIYRVPPSFPDTAGLKTSLHGVISPWDNVFPWWPIRCVLKDASRHFIFRYYRATSPKRAVIDVEPYYWDCLREPLEQADLDDVCVDRENEWRSIKRSPLTYRTTNKIKYIRSKAGQVQKKIVKSHIAECVSKQSTNFSVRETPSDQLYSDWI